MSLSWGHPLMSGIALLVTTTAVWHMVLTGERGESVAVLLVVVAAGAALLDRRWLLPTLALVWGIWLVGLTRTGGGSTVWRDWVAAMAAATVVGLAIHVSRRSSIEHADEAIGRAERAATEDALTGLLNRRGLALLGNEIVGVAQRTGEAAHCTFLDIDGLTAVNATLGRSEGDNLILSVAEGLRASVRGTDVVARWGGDQFVVVGLGSGTPLKDLDARVRGYLSTSFPDDPAVAGVHLSTGRSVLAPWDLGGLSAMLEDADRDMHDRRVARGHHSLVPFRAGAAEFTLDL